MTRERDILHLATALTGRDIVKRIAEKYGMTSAEIFGPRREQRLVAARHEAFEQVYRAFPSWSIAQIGRFFNKDHTTILASLRRQGLRSSEPMSNSPRHMMKSTLKGTNTGATTRFGRHVESSTENDDAIRMAERERLRQANILHLIDLKRAGYSPTMTELVIAGGGNGPATFQKASGPSSYCGSPAALCAGF